MENLPNIRLVNPYENDTQYTNLLNKYHKALENYVDSYRKLEKTIKNFNQIRKKYNQEPIKLW